MTDRGVFTLSLDTELAWGSFDKGGVERYGEAYRRTPTVVRRLCDLFDRYDVAATWAFVAHLFDDCEEHTSDDPDRREWLAVAPCASDVDRSLWYAPDLLKTVEKCTTPQDTGLHGYSHLVFDDHSPTAGQEELAAAVATAREVGLAPSSFVYPRNAIAHTDLLANYGIEVYRGADARWYEQRSLPAGRKPLRFLDEATTVTPPTVVPTERDDVVCVPGSQVFRPRNGAWAWTPDMSQRSRAYKGLDKAAETGRIFHLWFHPFNLAHDIDHHLSLLEDVFTYANSLRTDDKLKIMPLSDVAKAYRDGRWNTTPRGHTGVA